MPQRARWTLEPDDPRAPSQEIWDQMTPEERDAAVESLPSEFPPSEAHPPPEGDPHLDVWVPSRQTLRRWAKRGGRRMYVGGNMAIYYPGERMFSPDLFVVLDVEDHDRDSWIVAREGRGLDLALEVVVAGKRRKDFEQNVIRYARLGISEYYVLDWRPRTLVGYRLQAGERGPAYQRLIPQAGRLLSQVLGLELFMEGKWLRFALGDSFLLDAEQLITMLEGLVTDGVERAEWMEARLTEAQRLQEEAQRLQEEAQRLREEEQRLREEEQRRRIALEEETKRLQQELDQLRAKR